MTNAHGQHRAATIVVGFDAHPASSAALTFAAGIAAGLGAHLDVVHVIDPADAYPDTDAANWEELTQQRIDQLQSRVVDLLSDHDGKYTYRTVHGQPSRALVKAARDVGALMIVLGEPPQGTGARLGHLLSPSVAQQILHLHPVQPVLLGPAASGAPRTGQSAS